MRKIFTLLFLSAVALNSWAGFSYTYDQPKDSLTVKYERTPGEDPNFFNNNIGNLKNELKNTYVTVSTLNLVGDFGTADGHSARSLRGYQPRPAQHQVQVELHHVQDGVYL